MIVKTCPIHGDLTEDQCYAHRRKATKHKTRGFRRARVDYDCKECIKASRKSPKAAKRRRARNKKRYQEDLDFRRAKKVSEAIRYRADPERFKKRARDHRLNDKRKALAHYSLTEHPSCTLCGEDDLRFLCLDHVEGNGAEHRRKDPSVKPNPYLWARKNEFPPIFRTLCHNCNWLEHHIPGTSKSAEYNRRIKEEVYQHYSEGNLKCSLCDVSDIRILTLDHLDGGGSTHRREIGNGGTRMVRWIRKNGFPDGFRVLCFNHNLGAHCLG